jgi:hypothetical protein
MKSIAAILALLVGAASFAAFAYGSQPIIKSTVTKPTTTIGTLPAPK